MLMRVKGSQASSGSHRQSQHLKKLRGWLSMVAFGQCCQHFVNIHFTKHLLGHRQLLLRVNWRFLLRLQKWSAIKLWRYVGVWQEHSSNSSYQSAVRRLVRHRLLSFLLSVRQVSDHYFVVGLHFLLPGSQAS